jgi:hypothetical protein
MTEIERREQAERHALRAQIEYHETVARQQLSPWLPRSTGGAAVLGAALAGLMVWWIWSALQQDATSIAQRRQEYLDFWDGAVIAAICADGTRIMKTRDGRHFAGHDKAAEIDDVQTVCR